MLEIEALATEHVGPIDLTIPDGVCAVIHGPSGAGKTLFLRAVADLDPHTGRVTLDGRPAETFRPAAWRRTVQLLPPDPLWWAPTVGEHFEARPENEAATLGFGPDVWGWSVEHLSSGERQRLALLRALSRQPRVLLLDEPTANLDRDNILAAERIILRYLRAARAAVLWVSHDPAQRGRVADRSYHLAGGRLAPEAAA